MATINWLLQTASLVFERESQPLPCDRSPAVGVDSSAGLEQIFDTLINSLGKLLRVAWPHMLQPLVTHQLEAGNG